MIVAMVQAATSATQIDDLLASALECLNQNCPLSAATMAPDATCAVQRCYSNFSKCVEEPFCRDKLKCMSDCTLPLANTSQAAQFISLQACVRDHCPGFPPSKTCASLHCSKEGLICATHVRCLKASLCDNACIFKKTSLRQILAPLSNQPRNQPHGVAMKSESVVKARSADGLLASAMTCLDKYCPLSAETMTPDSTCVLNHCYPNVSRCVAQPLCRDELGCIGNCTLPLAGTKDAEHFLALQICLRNNCPSFPPSKACAALHCAKQGAVCAMNLRCLKAATCDNFCIREHIRANEELLV